MTKVFTVDLFFIFQQIFCIFPVNKLNNYPFVVTSAIPWERELVTTLNTSSVHIYSRLLANVNNSILQIFIADTVRYAWQLYIIPSAILLPFRLIFLKVLGKNVINRGKISKRETFEWNTFIKQVKKGKFWSVFIKFRNITK